MRPIRIRSKQVLKIIRLAYLHIIRAGLVINNTQFAFDKVDSVYKAFKIERHAIAHIPIKCQFLLTRHIVKRTEAMVLN